MLSMYFGKGCECGAYRVRRNWSSPELRRPERHSPGMLPEREAGFHRCPLLFQETACCRIFQWAERDPRVRKVEDSSSLLRSSKRMGVWPLCVFSGYKAVLC